AGHVDEKLKAGERRLSIFCVERHGLGWLRRVFCASRGGGARPGSGPAAAGLFPKPRAFPNQA
ncbi:MAG TPA: hypothetical protein VN939_21810, partial [Chthoniobacterales bacterium]|nr:hypothetical protein [Chthoniobacterales bacterium]